MWARLVTRPCSWARVVHVAVAAAPLPRQQPLLLRWLVLQLAVARDFFVDGGIVDSAVVADDDQQLHHDGCCYYYY